MAQERCIVCNRPVPEGDLDPMYCSERCKERDLADELHAVRFGSYPNDLSGFTDAEDDEPLFVDDD